MIRRQHLHVRNVLAFTVVFCSALLGQAFGQQNSPCPNIFQYNYDSEGDEWYGLIQVPSPNPGSALSLNVHLTVTARLPTSYVGRLELYTSREETIKRISYRRPILYIVRFPIRHPIPKVTSILYNNNVICGGDNGNNFPERVTYITKIDLEHLLYTSNGFGNRPKPIPDYLGRLGTTNPINYPPAPKVEAVLQSKVDVPEPVYQEPITQPPPSTPAALTDSPQCGQLDSEFAITPLIYGGEQINRGQWPWLAAIHAYIDTSFSFRCGGSLISPKLILTAAHCVKGREIKSLRLDDIIVFLGQSNIKKLHDQDTISTGLSAIHVHPDFMKDTKGSYDADIAILIMKKFVEFTKFIQPVCLWNGPIDETQIFGKSGVVVGWGKDETGNLVTKAPKRAVVPIVSHIDCIRSTETFARITSPRTICGGGKNDIGPCNGDSGGGLIMYQNNSWQIRGIISIALADPVTGICNLREFVVFTDVAKFLDWIHPFMSIT